MVSGGECVMGARHEAEIKSLQEKDKELAVVNDQQWTAINDGRDRFEEALREIGNRLPNWAVAIAALGATAIGVLVTLAFK